METAVILITAVLTAVDTASAGSGTASSAGAGDSNMLWQYTAVAAVILGIVVWMFVKAFRRRRRGVSGGGCCCSGCAISDRCSSRPATGGKAVR